MRIRTQLILASFFLAVLPLAAIVLWSYHSSRRALESTYRKESQRLNAQMDRRIERIRAELDQRLAVVSNLPLQQAKAGGTTKGGENVVGNVVAAMGTEVASLVDSLEFQPVPQKLPPPPERPAEPRPATEPAPRTDPVQKTEPAPRVAVRRPVPGTRYEITQVTPATALAHGEHPTILHVEPIVIDIPPPPEFPRYVLPPEHKELIREIGRLAGQMKDPNLRPEDRAETQKALDSVQRELTRVMHEAHSEYAEQAEAARKVQEERRELLRRRVAEQLAKDRARVRERRTQEASSLPPTPAVEAPAQVASTETTATVEAPEPAPKKVAQKEVRNKTAADTAKTKKTDKQVELILGRSFAAPVQQAGQVVGQISANVRPQEVIDRILGATDADSDEVPFAIDREGTLYTRTPAHREQLEKLGVDKRVRANKPLNDIEGWIVTSSIDKPSGLRIGVARPVGDNLDELRKTAAQNFVLGLGLIAFAVIGVVPLANHLTRDVKLVTDGAQRVAHGDLMTRLPVKSKNEFGQLALAFNRMAEDLSLQQQKLLEQERARKEQELQQRLMSVEYERKSVELEDARRFQLSMLPKEVPRHGRFDVAVYTRTATEVGGDYYDFHVSKDVLSVTIGDATGHGAKAGTMVTVVKTLFAGYGGAIAPAAFLSDAAERIKRMELGRMSMALSLARFDGKHFTVATAGMPPVLIRRADGGVEEIALGATPLGTLGTDYDETSLELHAGDTVLFLTDGFPELLNDAGQQLGYVAAQEAFANAAASATNADGVIAALVEVAARWHGDTPPNDDVTFVVVRVR